LIHSVKRYKAILSALRVVRSRPGRSMFFFLLILSLFVILFVRRVYTIFKYQGLIISVINVISMS
jgi:hypothetical protein